MRKSVIKFLIFLAVLCGIGYVAVHILLDRFSYKALTYAISRLQGASLKLSDPSFRKAGFSAYNAITWEDFAITAIVGPNSFSKGGFSAKMDVEALTVEAKGLFDGLFVISLKGLRISTHLAQDASLPEGDAPEAFLEGNLAVPFKLKGMSLAQTKAQIRDFGREIKRFSEDGKTALPLKFTAEEAIMLKGNSYKVSLWVEKKGEVYGLVANRDDLKFIGRNILPQNQTLTPADIEIIANNPLRAPRLLKIRSKASDDAFNAHKKEPTVPEKAYRHVLWSYLLFMEYGEAFAKEVTDAHELETDPEEKGNPDVEAEHRQDYKNNAIGRKYAALAYEESNILNLVRTDPHVIR